MDKQNDTKKTNVCMACQCPCDMHKEHTHDKKEQKTLVLCAATNTRAMVHVIAAVNK